MLLSLNTLNKQRNAIFYSSTLGKMHVHRMRSGEREWRTTDLRMEEGVEVMLREEDWSVPALSALLYAPADTAFLTGERGDFRRRRARWKGEEGPSLRRETHGGSVW